MLLVVLFLQHRRLAHLEARRQEQIPVLPRHLHGLEHLYSKKGNLTRSEREGDETRTRRGLLTGQGQRKRPGDWQVKVLNLQEGTRNESSLFSKALTPSAVQP